MVGQPIAGAAAPSSPEAPPSSATEKTSPSLYGVPSPTSSDDSEMTWPWRASETPSPTSSEAAGVAPVAQSSASGHQGLQEEGHTLMDVKLEEDCTLTDLERSARPPGMSPMMPRGSAAIRIPRLQVVAKPAAVTRPAPRSSGAPGQEPPATAPAAAAGPSSSTAARADPLEPELQELS